MLGQTNIWFLLNVQDFATHKKAVRALNEKKYENKCIHLQYKLNFSDIACLFLHLHMYIYMEILI